MQDDREKSNFFNQRQLLFKNFCDAKLQFTGIIFSFSNLVHIPGIYEEKIIKITFFRFGMFDRFL